MEKLATLELAPLASEYLVFQTTKQLKKTIKSRDIERLM